MDISSISNNANLDDKLSCETAVSLSEKKSHSGDHTYVTEPDFQKTLREHDEKLDERFHELNERFEEKHQKVDEKLDERHREVTERFSRLEDLVMSMNKAGLAECPGRTKNDGLIVSDVKDEVEPKKEHLRHCRKPTIDEFFNETTLHGAPEFYRARRSQKVIWGVLLLAAFCACAYGCYEIVAQYRAAPVAVSYMVQRSKDSMRLPDVVICPFNRFNKSFFSEHAVSQCVQRNVHTIFHHKQPLPIEEYEYEPSCKPMLDKHLHEMGNITFDDFLDKASYSCNSLIKYCVEAGHFHYNCCETAIPVTTEYAKCYRLLGINQTKPGLYLGLTVVAEAPSDNYSSHSNKMLHNLGFITMLVENDKEVNFDVNYVPVGAHVLMKMRQRRYVFSRAVCSGRFVYLSGNRRLTLRFTSEFFVVLPHATWWYQRVIALHS